MYTYGNNAFAMAQSDIMEKLTAYTDKELTLLMKNAYNFGRQNERIYQRKMVIRKRKEHLENIKLTITLFFGMVIFPFAMFLYWLMIGY